MVKNNLKQEALQLLENDIHEQCFLTRNKLDLRSCLSFRTAIGSRGCSRLECLSADLHLQQLRTAVIRDWSQLVANKKWYVPMTVPRSVTFRPKYTSPVTVRWSSSMIFGIFLNRFWNCWIFKHNNGLELSLSYLILPNTYLLEMIAEFDNRCSTEQTLFVDYKLTVLQRVDVTLDKK